MEHLFSINLCGRKLFCSVRFPETISLFERFYPQGSPRRIQLNEIDAALLSPWNKKLISVHESDWVIYEKLGMLPCPATEYSILTEYCSDALMDDGCVIIHAAAISHNGKAYLICGPSGAGKTTQARTLQELRPGEFGIICGDRPILEFLRTKAIGDTDSEHSNTPSMLSQARIIVNPSPWNGKEYYHDADSAPLYGIILLERGEKNSLFAVSEKEAAIPVYTYLIQTGWYPEMIRRAAALTTRLVHNVPIWKLISHKVPDSTMLLLESLFAKPESRGQGSKEEERL